MSYLWSTVYFKAGSGNPILTCIGFLYNVIMYGRILFAYYYVYKAYEGLIDLDSQVEDAVTARDATRTVPFCPHSHWP